MFFRSGVGRCGFLWVGFGFVGKWVGEGVWGWGDGFWGGKVLGWRKIEVGVGYLKRIFEEVWGF